MRSGMELLRRSMGKSFRLINDLRGVFFTTVQNPECIEDVLFSSSFMSMYLIIKNEVP
jgi:hypothetical protein